MVRLRDTAHIAEGGISDVRHVANMDGTADSYRPRHSGRASETGLRAARHGFPLRGNDGLPQRVVDKNSGGRTRVSFLSRYIALASLYAYQQRLGLFPAQERQTGLSFSSDCMRTKERM